MHKEQQQGRQNNEKAGNELPHSKNQNIEAQHKDNLSLSQGQFNFRNYILHWVVFVVAAAIYVGVWAVDYYAFQRQASFFYKSAKTVSPATDNAAYTDSTAMFTNSNPFDTLGITVSLAYSWILWKLPLVAYCYHLITPPQSKAQPQQSKASPQQSKAQAQQNEAQKGKILKLATFFVELLLLLGLDIALTIFTSSFYNEWIFYGAYCLLTLIVAIVNNYGAGRTKQAVLNTIIPLAIIATLYVVYALLLPTLYKLYNDKIGGMSATFLIVYGYPAIDLLIYSLVLLLGTKVDEQSQGIKTFFSSIHYMLIGYGAGMILLVGYTQVEFYYLLAYFIFRNVFANHIMRNWEEVVSNPPALPGWGVIYYLSYGLSYIPVIGVGKVVIAKSFMSYIFAKTSTLLYGAYNPLYFSAQAPNANLPNLNISMGGNIFWLSGLIIWLGTTFSQRYPSKAPQLHTLFYYLLGIYLFYLGIACSLSVTALIQSNSF